MSDVFISYARSQERAAGLIAQALRGQGFSVWRDDELPAHRDYSAVIEERLRAAKAVVVAWSIDAVNSQWVCAEADVAREAGTLVQLNLDGAPLPLPFNRIQCADLRGWRGELSAAGWQKVTRSVADLIASGGGSPAVSESPPRPRPSPTTPDTFSIALTPFSEPAGAVAGDDFAGGLLAEMGTALGRFPVLRVMDADPGAVARYRLEGTIRRSGPSVRINVQLRDAARGERVWTERFDAAFDDAFALQEDVADMVAGRVESAVLANETRAIAARPIESLTAHELWLRTRETIRRAALEQVDEIEALCARAVALDPGHALSLVLQATGMGFRIAYAGAGEDTAALKAQLAATIDRAMLRGAEDPEVLAFAAEAMLLAEGDMDVARAFVDRALQMNQGLVVGWDIAGNIRMQSGEYEAALARYERCLHLDPKSPWRTYVWPSMGGCMVALGRFQEAIVLVKEGLQIGPNNPWAAAILIAALAHSGRLDEARAALAQFDQRQAGVLKTSTFGPRLGGLIDVALALVDWTDPGVGSNPA